MRGPCGCWAPPAALARAQPGDPWLELGLRFWRRNKLWLGLSHEILGWDLGWDFGGGSDSGTCSTRKSLVGIGAGVLVGILVAFGLGFWRRNKLWLMLSYEILGWDLGWDFGGILVGFWRRKPSLSLTHIRWALRSPATGWSVWGSRWPGTPACRPRRGPGSGSPADPASREQLENSPALVTQGQRHHPQTPSKAPWGREATETLSGFLGFGEGGEAPFPLLGHTNPPEFPSVGSHLLLLLDKTEFGTENGKGYWDVQI